MSQTTVVKVKVEELSKFGYKANGRYVNYSKQLSEEDKARVVPGAEFEAEYFVSDSGKEYLNKVLSATVTAPKSVEKSETKPDTERAKRFTPKFNKEKAPDNAMTRADWDAKDQRISRQGVIQAAVIALAPVVSLEALPEEAVKLATEMLAFVKGE
jgi:hypothetical protein